ncbi:ABC transporter substrate-binding protein [Mycetocola tolaasinivorans]|uniref:ABC transporter substrate-binding protein n=1 Tax=Mycetocola tolaasinivorans TaxID=76635 RepID=A0A3L7ACL9_9MICO|nr:ABC transporter substrate-binding protein [Mycetocola tolaasinivorans]
MRASAAVAALTLTAGLLSACSTGAAPASSEGASATRTFASAYGDVKIPEKPLRVAAVSYDTPWQLMSLDVKPVAAQDYGKWIKEFSDTQQDFVKGVPTAGSFGELNYEALAATKPDLIVGDAYEIDESVYKRLSAIAPTAIAKGKDRGDWQGLTEQIAEAVGKTDAWKGAKSTYETERDRIKTTYAAQISGNSWAHFSLGDDAGQFSIQEPTGAIGNLVVNELGMKYGPGVPTNYDASGYHSYPFEQLGTVFTGVSVALHPINQDGSVPQGIQDVLNNDLFTRLPVAQAKHVYGLKTSITDYVTATEWLHEVEKTVLSAL